MTEEDHLTIACANLCRMVLAPCVRFAHVPNEGKRSKAAGGKAKAMGMLAGFPDLWFGWPMGQTGYIELKVPGGPGKRPGALSPAQKEFRDWCRASGHLWMECRSIAEVYATLKGWKVPLKGEGFHAYLDKNRP